MKRIQFILSLSFLLYSNSFCRKFIEVDLPVDTLNSDIVFADAQTAGSAVIGLYTSMMAIQPVISSGGVTVYTGLSSDELYNSNVANTTASEFFANSVLPTNSIMSANFWQKGYSIIYHANACVKGIEHNPQLNQSAKNQLLGEAYLTRAFIYYYMVNLFGDVPLLLTTDYLENQQTARTPVDVVYAQIVTDLKNAGTLLGEDYATNERVRPNRWAATALLARVYLTLGQWELAESESSQVIDNGHYSLEANLNDVFLASSTEAIWQLMPVTQGYNTTEGMTFVPAGWSAAPPNFPLTSHLMSDFEPGDGRLQHWVTSKTVQDQVYFYPYKYKIGEYGFPLTEYYMLCRLGEQYLIRAEALARQDKTEAAMQDLNMIRQRAGLPFITTNTRDELLNAIARERRIELFAEWGHRWIDLKRTQKSTDVLSPVKPGWQATDTLFPIPLSEIQLNPALQQNPGY